MSGLNWLILIAVGIFVVTKVYDKFERGENPDAFKKHCMTCGSEAEPVKRTKGSIGIELILWICFIVPGLIYSIWRLSSRGLVCPSCGGTQLVPVNSPAAIAQRKILAQ